MNRLSLSLAAAVLIVSAASSRAEDSTAPSVAKPAASSASPVDSSPSPAPETKTEAKPAAKAETKSEGGSAQAPSAPAAAPEKTSSPEAKSEAKPDAKPAVRPEAKAEEKPAQATVAAAPAPEKARVPESKPVEKPLNTCAAKLEPVVDSYQQAHDGLSAWLRTASEKMDSADDKIAGLKKNIAENEARITQLKLESAQKNEAQERELDRATRDLWSQLKTEEAHRKDLCRALSSVAGQKVCELNRAVLEQFDKAAQTP
jgi:hypothetical protein